VSNFSEEQSARREKTLLAALLLSMWGPLATGIAVILSSSTTQLADFIRRSVELMALAVSWWVFRYLARNKKVDHEQTARMEKTAGISVSIALCCSGIVMLVLALSRVSTFQPGGNVYPGLAIAVMGLVVNTWFWQRYSRLNREKYSSVINAQGHLYRAKALVDLCVITALSAVAIAPAHPATSYIDVLGSVVVALYLLWSSFRTAQRAVLDANSKSSVLLERYE